MSDTHDVIVIGAGHNGLVCASYLAAAGRRVTVLEQSSHVGGAARTRPFAAGFSVSSGAHLLTMLNREVIAELKLEQHGLRMAASNLRTIALDGAGNTVSLNAGQASGKSLSQADASEYASFYAEMVRYAAILARTFKQRPPRLVETDLHDKLNLLKLGWDIRRLGRDSMRELLRIGLINIYDLVSDRFDNDLLRAAIAMDGVLGTAMGVRSPNTVMSYLYRRVGDVFGYAGASLPEGGMGAVGLALAKAATERGVVLRTDCKVQRIEVDAGRATGVLLASGERITARTVISNADPRTTMQSLVGFPQLDAGFARRISTIRMQGSAAKLHLALDELPQFIGLDRDELGQRLLLCPGLAQVERAFNPWKYGEYSPRPVLEFCIPTLHDSAMAPAGKHVLSAVVQYAPYKIDGGWDAAREGFRECIIDQLALCAPDLRKRIVAAELLTPVDLEHEFGMHGGHWHHGEIGVDQLLMLRPVPLAAQYAMPIDGLYLCGAGAHPGGGVMGLAGRNAAQEIQRREKTA